MRDAGKFAAYQIEMLGQSVWITEQNGTNPRQSRDVPNEFRISNIDDLNTDLVETMAKRFIDKIHDFGGITIPD
jgi:hypothetical protein